MDNIFNKEPSILLQWDGFLVFAAQSLSTVDGKCSTSKPRDGNRQVPLRDPTTKQEIAFQGSALPLQKVNTHCKRYLQYGKHLLHILPRQQ